MRYEPRTAKKYLNCEKSCNYLFILWHKKASIVNVSKCSTVRSFTVALYCMEITADVIYSLFG